MRRVTAAMLPLLLAATLAHAQAPPPTKNPHGSFRQECALCHRSDAWKPAQISARFDHATFGFGLDGAHATARCLSCHTSLEFKKAETQCMSCHDDPHRGEMGTVCASCHTSRSFVDRGPMMRAHALTRFPLTGGHITVDCEKCHTPAAQGQMQFVGTATECRACHMEQFTATTAPNHVTGAFPTACMSCHTTVAWKTASFDHDRTAFPLTGAHRAASCVACHTSGEYTRIDTSCQSCHQADYGRASPPHAAAGFAPSACVSCHTTATWSGAQFDHNATQFPLTGAHMDAACMACHSDDVFNGKSSDCSACHMPDYRATTSPPHGTSTFPPSACATCHTTTKWTAAAFDHNVTRFALTGAHLNTACLSCHASGVYAGTSSDCQTCHESDYARATPPHDATAFPRSACASCHTTTMWSGGAFDHSRTDFALTGAHVDAACMACHSDGAYDGRSTACQSCHQSDYAAASPPHVAAGFAASACASCHTTATWSGATFDHNATSFPLTGAHLDAACMACHSDNVFTGKPTDCYACHAGDYATAQPNHATSGFPASECASCHTTTTWAGAVFDHARTDFPLTGAHMNAACMACHADGVYNGKSTTCESCHQSDYAAATPNHTAAGFAASACASCHTTSTWTGAAYDHNATAFPLTGAHVDAACMTCHSDDVFTGKSGDCYSCHATDYNTATPDHVTSGFQASACASCHNTTTWGDGHFDHAQTDFPLTGAHTTAACMACHADGVYNGKSTACESCHQADYTAAQPNHSAAGFAASACASCHTTTTWIGGVYDHNATSFPLTGAHVDAACMTCHGDNVFNGKSGDCYSCHATDYNTATPDHVASGFQASACASCHNTTTWGDGNFDHAQTDFPLTGAHTTAACMACHADGVYNGKSTACESCHQSDYDNAVLDHSAAGFQPSACATCHTTTMWTGGTFDHNTTSFALTGAHVDQACLSCHADNMFNGKSGDCYSCHATDYNNAVPNHSAAGFAPSACASCHTTTTWTGATFDHDGQWFPIYSGAHQGKWTSCETCHTSPTHYAVFTCLVCHPHDDKNKTDGNHSGVRNYAYDSNACYTCHPDGRH